MSRANIVSPPAAGFHNSTADSGGASYWPDACPYHQHVINRRIIWALPQPSAATEYAMSTLHSRAAPGIEVFLSPLIDRLPPDNLLISKPLRNLCADGHANCRRPAKRVPNLHMSAHAIAAESSRRCPVALAISRTVPRLQGRFSPLTTGFYLATYLSQSRCRIHVQTAL